MQTRFAHCSSRRRWYPDGPTKDTDSCTTLAYVGIEICTIANELRIPAAYIAKSRTLLSEWLTCRTARLPELQSLAGVLNHLSILVVSECCY
jgi:hypothetical protein